jgi:cobalt-precorrin 5A hydrolase
MPRIAIYALTRQGAALGARLRDGLGAELFAPDRFAGEHGATPFDALLPLVGRTFGAFDGHVFIAAAGIVVRAIAPHLRDKATDPAVVVLDGEGKFIVSLLAGHLGGANDLARGIAGLTGGQAVVTTATDGAGLPSLELIARDKGLMVENLEPLKFVSGALVDGQHPWLHDPEGWLGPGLEEFFRTVASAEEEPDEPGVVVTWRTVRTGPRVLVLRPRCLAAGIGCRRGTASDEIEAFVRDSFAAHGLALGSLAAIGTIEAKRDEAGLIQAASRLGVELAFFPAGELDAVDVPSPSRFPKQHVGTASVCEAAATLLAGGGRLVLPKVKADRITLAVALVRRQP